MKDGRGQNRSLCWFLPFFIFNLLSLLLLTAARGDSSTIIVDPNGPLSSISAAAKLARAGDTVVILPGTYHEWINQTESGTPERPITFVAQKPGTVILDATGFKTALNSNFANSHWVTIKGLTIKNCSNPDAADIGALNTGDGWRLEDVMVDGADGTGIDVWGDGVVLLRVTVKNCGRAGLSGGGCTHVLVKDCITTGNNTKKNNPSWDAGAGKWNKTDHVTVDGLDSHDNIGPGLWFDYNNTNVVIRNCKIHDNHGLKHDFEGFGLNLELNPGPVEVENNQFYNNSGGNIGIQSCRQVMIKNNVFTGSYLDIRDWPRGEDYTLQDFNVSNNKFDGAKVSASGGTWDVNSAATKRIVFSQNTYIHPPSPLFTWGGAFYTLQEARTKLGLEK